MIYSCITGHNDEPHEPIADGDYHIFLDRELPELNGWKQWQAVDMFLDNRRNARMHKILMPDKDCIWVDGNIKIKIPENELWDMLGDNDIMVHKHEFRDCVYQEAAAILNYRLDSPDIIARQVERYKKDNYPEHNGLAETGILIRRNTDKVKELNRMWWEEISRCSKRDQMSFDYCCWKLGIEYATFPKGIRANDIFELRRHER